ncbi:MAG TPA: DNA-processing protein DprA [Candidatus Saccharimonadales bacterium]|nr:DNA-processing protein DprA [Candidatus Saccharimonadales bacterium]
MKVIRLTDRSRGYPERLNVLHNPPKRLHTLGEDVNKLLSTPVLGIVGSRKVTSYGRAVTEELAESAVRAGICIVSGLALGVDSIAHMSALRLKGRTIAVLPSGLKSIYPASHRKLAKEIAVKGGTLVSEYDDDFKPRRESFIQRNRIIAGLSDALLVTEAAERSGSLYTANFALEAGRTVLAVPGSMNSPNSKGTNNLIKQGAIMVTSEQDIFDALKISPDKLEQLDIYGDNEQETAVLIQLKSGIQDGDELLKLCKMDIRSFQQTLTMLEIKGVIAPLGNNQWRLK